MIGVVVVVVRSSTAGRIMTVIGGGAHAGRENSFLGISCRVIREWRARIVEGKRSRGRMLRNGILERTEGEIVAKGRRHAGRTGLLLAGR